MSEWVCTKCGSAGAHPLPGFTQLDDRYTTGYCDVCTVAVPDKPRKGPRPTSELIAAAHFDRAAFTEHSEKVTLAKLVHKYANGKANVSMSDRECWMLVSLFDKWGAPGFGVTDSLRKVADQYAGAMAPKKKSPVRSRGAA